MNSPMDRYLNERVISQLDRIFEKNPNGPQVSVSVFGEVQVSDRNCHLELQPKKDIHSVAELQKTNTKQEDNEYARIYTIKHLHTWKKLLISHELFDCLLKRHQVFQEFWKHILTFGFKMCENEYTFPPATARNSQSNLVKTHELAYVIRRVEPSSSRPEDFPWSIRQTGLYHRLEYGKNPPQKSQSVFILVAPSSAVESDLSRCLLGRTPQGEIACSRVFTVHVRLIRESLSGMVPYMSWIEEQLTFKSIRYVSKPLDTECDDRLCLFSNDDRQSLNRLDDCMTNLLVILQAKVTTINRVKKSLQQHCLKTCVEECSHTCDELVEELEEHAIEAETYQARAKILQDKVQSIQRLLSNLLDYKQMCAMKELAEAAHEESIWMREISFLTFRDSNAMKVLAIIGIVCLPTTVVENFFSTQFVDVQQNRLQVSSQAWVMAAVVAPLTILIMVLWKLWINYEYTCWVQPVPTRSTRFDRLKMFFNIWSRREIKEAELELGTMRGFRRRIS